MINDSFQFKVARSIMYRIVDNLYATGKKKDENVAGALSEVMYTIDNADYVCSNVETWDRLEGQLRFVISKYTSLDAPFVE